MRWLSPPISTVEAAAGCPGWGGSVSPSLAAWILSASRRHASPLARLPDARRARSRGQPAGPPARRRLARSHAPSPLARL